MLSLQNCIFCLFFTISSCELFTAVVDLEKLLHTESEVIKTIDKYIELEEKRLSEIRKYVFKKLYIISVKKKKEKTFAF